MKIIKITIISEEEIYYIVANKKQYFIKLCFFNRLSG